MDSTTHTSSCCQWSLKAEKGELGVFSYQTRQKRWRSKCNHTTESHVAARLPAKLPAHLWSLASRLVPFRGKWFSVENQNRSHGPEATWLPARSEPGQKASQQTQLRNSLSYSLIAVPQHPCSLSAHYSVEGGAASFRCQSPSGYLRSQIWTPLIPIIMSDSEDSSSSSSNQSLVNKSIDPALLELGVDDLAWSWGREWLHCFWDVRVLFISCIQFARCSHIGDHQSATGRSRCRWRGGLPMHANDCCVMHESFRINEKSAATICPRVKCAG